MWLWNVVLSSWGRAFPCKVSLPSPPSVLVLPLPIHSQELLRLSLGFALFGLRPGNPSALSRIGTKPCVVTFWFCWGGRKSHRPQGSFGEGWRREELGKFAHRAYVRKGIATPIFPCGIAIGLFPVAVIGKSLHYVNSAKGFRDVNNRT